MIGVPVTGRIDEATKRGISSFRKKHQMTEEPIIDKDAFNILLEEYKYPTHRFEGLEFGSRGEDIYCLNRMLAFFINRLCLCIPQPKGEYYTRETQNAIKEIRQHFSSRISDSKFYHLLEYCYQTLKSSVTLPPHL